MAKIMRSLSGHTQVTTHDGKSYKPNKKGEFEVDDGHVAQLRAHGLLLDDEADRAASEKLSIATREKLEAENAELKRQLADSTLAKENEDLKRQLAEIQAAGPKK